MKSIAIRSLSLTNILFMKKFFTATILFIGLFSFAQVKFSSWNIQHMGKSKSEESIAYIAQTLRDFDVVAIQEVVAGPGGAQSVARLADELNRLGAKWNYRISDPTKSSPYSSERYAYLWKTSKVKLIGKPWLDLNFVDEIEREPYFMQIQYKGEILTLVNFHAVPTKKQPETEIKYFKQYPNLYPYACFIFMGDFNLTDMHTVFNPLKKQGFVTAFTQQKTSVKRKCDTQLAYDCLSKSYDHFLIRNDQIQLIDSGVVYFYNDFETIDLARKISDHLPIWVEVDVGF